jgi:positive phototaxis protein PixI
MPITLSPEAVQSPGEPRQFLSVFLPPDTQAMISTQQLVEIFNLAPKQIAPIPGLPPQVMGACNWRGEVLWLVDLGQLLGKTPFYQLFQQRDSQAYYSAVVVQFQGCVMGLVVDQVRQIQICDPHSILMPTDPDHFKLPPCVEGYWLSPQGEALWVLNCEALVNRFREPVLANGKSR